MDNIELILLGVFVGFAVYAVVLLAPIYRFLRREEETARDLTREDLERQLNQMQQPSTTKKSVTESPPST